jgi:hypothetical protein
MGNSPTGLGFDGADNDQIRPSRRMRNDGNAQRHLVPRGDFRSIPIHQQMDGSGGYGAYRVAPSRPQLRVVTHARKGLPGDVRVAISPEHNDGILKPLNPFLTVTARVEANQIELPSLTAPSMHQSMSCIVQWLRWISSRYTFRNSATSRTVLGPSPGSRQAPCPGLRDHYGSNDQPYITEQ